MTIITPNPSYLDSQSTVEYIAESDESVWHATP
jgi:hypothetical protein